MFQGSWEKESHDQTCRRCYVTSEAMLDNNIFPLWFYIPLPLMPLSTNLTIATSWHSNRYMQINLNCRKGLKKRFSKSRSPKQNEGRNAHDRGFQTSSNISSMSAMTRPPGRVRVVQASTSRQHFLFWLIFPEFCRAVEMSGGGSTNHSAGWGHVVPAGQSQRRTGQTMLYEDVQQFVARGLTNICILPR